MNIEKLTDKDALLLRAACSKDLRTFIYFVHKAVEGTNFKFHPFLNEMLDAFQAIGDYKLTKNVVINMPPGWGKTRPTKYFLAWTLLKNPNVCHLYTSYSDKLIGDCSDDVKKVVECDFCQRLWGYQIRPDKKSKHNWAVEGTYQTSGITAASMDGTITGVNGGNPALIDEFCGSIIIDDPQKPQDMVYESYRRGTVETYNKTIKNRKRRHDVPIILIMQRLDEEDLTGHVIANEPENWVHIKVPALVEGKSQNPDNITTEALLTMRDKRPQEFWSQYQQEPTAELNYAFGPPLYPDSENVVNEYLLKKALENSEKNRQEISQFLTQCFNGGICLLDKAFGGTDGTAFCTINQVDGFYFIRGHLRKGTHYQKCMSELYSVRDEMLAGTIYTETNDDKKAIQGMYSGVQGYPERENKYRKIQTHLYGEWNQIIWHPKTDPEYILQCRSFNEFAKNDDAPDNAASAIRQIKKHSTQITSRPF